MELIRPANFSSQRRAFSAIMAGGLLLGFLILFFVPPSDLPFPNCTFHSITGHSCLTCGLTRSLHAVSHGEFAESVGYHLLGPALFSLMLLYFAIFTFEAIGGRKFEVCAEKKTKIRIFAMFAIVWIVYCGGRIILECAAT